VVKATALICPRLQRVAVLLAQMAICPRRKVQHKNAHKGCVKTRSEERSQDFACKKHTQLCLRWEPSAVPREFRRHRLNAKHAQKGNCQKETGHGATFHSPAAGQLAKQRTTKPTSHRDQPREKGICPFLAEMPVPAQQRLGTHSTAPRACALTGPTFTGV